MKIKIPDITLSADEVFSLNKDIEKELERQENARKKSLRCLYNAIFTEKFDIAFWDSQSVNRPGYNSFMRYALHRSTKKDGFLQLSVMEIRNGDIIPTSDSQHKCPDSFIDRVGWGKIEFIKLCRVKGKSI